MPTTTPLQIPADVLAFCQEHGVEPILHSAIRLLQETFPESPIEISLMHGCDCEGSWVVVESLVRGDRKEAFERHRGFLRQWVQGEISSLIRPTYTML
jgi:hypothetical protein